MAKPALVSKIAEALGGGSPVEKARLRVARAEEDLSKLVAEIDATRGRIREGALAERETGEDERRLGELEARRPGLAVRLDALRPVLAEAERKAAEEQAAARRAEDEARLARIAGLARLVRRGTVGAGRDFLAGLARLDLLERDHEVVAARLGADPLQIDARPDLVLADAAALALDDVNPDEEPPSRLATLAVPVLLLPRNERP